MREIKFRVWNKATKTMHYPDWHELAVRAKLAEMLLRQYTGLRDSEAVEEYFGDIIEEDDGTRRVIEDGVSVVAFRIVGGKNIKYFWDLLPHKVIGNIYENADLLEVKDDAPSK